ncbi:MAG: hypothetical protein ACJZ7Z_04045 [Myxococcota bacterium]
MRNTHPTIRASCLGGLTGVLATTTAAFSGGFLVLLLLESAISQ